MNKGRIEAFTDAVIAIIVTIMILEFKTPESLRLSAILTQLPYLVSYFVGAMFIATSWYNHHYLFAKTKVVTKAVFWANNAWMFGTSFLPVATAWVSRDLNARGPEIFYTIAYTVWTVAYIVLTYTIVHANERAGHPEVAAAIRAMPVTHYFTRWQFVIIQIIAQVLALIFFPALNLVIVILLIIWVAFNSNDDSDKLFND
ncbi:TMEM175 family protein [Lacticaseibacillus pabuli]|uniref:TMEM175 family protein n=1 Tax=Lacticaseibacillus pabuli TaxID=3025672 RepID=A0ABY7WSZ6_9LACO|nr:TMEM175 family protein [Lacticaseibacillus sp. KACC 23028]WDF83298.1 TMEM175 family protein [Lacticaseibacillus sp. KACC 23028]